MADSTGIAWTDATWNPIVGCSLVSPGCTNCYAMHQAYRIIRMNKGKPSHYDGTIKTVNGNPVWTGALNVAPDHILTQPLRWEKPRRIFVNSMSDLFHEAVPDEWIDQVFAIMALCPQHTFQVLTKRSKRMRDYLSRPDVSVNVGLDALSRTLVEHSNNPKSTVGRGCMLKATDINPGALKIWPLANVWLGVSAEDQKRAEERIPDLLATPAAKRFVSAEPLLGLIDFRYIHHEYLEWMASVRRSADTKWLDWIIVGGESGPSYRPMDPAAVSSIRLQCEAAGVAFFFKQDSASKPGQQGRASDALWARKEFPS